MATEFSQFAQNVNHASEKHRTLEPIACDFFFFILNLRT